MKNSTKTHSVLEGSNVLPFRPRWSTGPSSSCSDSGPIKKAPSPICLHGTNSTQLSRTALHIHSLTESWAFIGWSDIREQIKTAQDLLSLGEATIFVARIDTLEARESQLILSLLFMSQMPGYPSFILGCSDWETLSQNLSPLEKEMLSNRKVDVDRLPLSTELREATLQLLFFK